MYLFIIALVLASTPSTQATTTRADQFEELRVIEQRLAEAWVKGDRDYINRILADDWSVIDAAGRILSKNQVMQEAFESNDRQIESLEIDDVRVRAFDNGAVVTGRTRAKGSYKGTSMSVTLRFTDVFVRRSGKWQVVASQATQVAP